MFHDRAIEHRINRIDKPDKFTTEILATETYKDENNISPEILNSLFIFTNESSSLRNALILKRKRSLAVHFESKCLSSLAPKIWEIVPDSMREEKELSNLKNKIKGYTTEKCLYRLSKNYIGRI